MGSCSCTRRHFLLSTCFLQMITIIERQVFDFLGYMWAPILVNFFQILFIIFGFYGAYHFRIKYIITYLLWNFVWIGWNAFLICFYLNVGSLDRDSDLLNMGTGSVSWFEANGYGCKPTYNITSDDPYRPLRPERVDDCLLDYPLVEVIHSGAQCALALLGILGAILISCIFLDEDDRLQHINKQSKHRQSLYSMEFGASSDTIRHRSDLMLGLGLGLGGDGDARDQNGGELSPKPMTPRRVKRRSVMARGTHGRQSSSGSTRRSHHGSSSTLRSKHGGHGDSSSGSYVRSSTRSSRRKYQQNPVTKLLDQQQLQQQQQLQLQQQQHLHQPPPPPQLGSFHRSSLTASNLQCLHDDNNVAVGSLGKSNNHYYRRNIPLDPIYYNTNGQGMLLEQPAASPPLPPPPPPPAPLGGGHYNPSYQHSNTQLNDVGHAGDELYNNRPPSVRSSYSNFHGSRPLAAAYNTTENVFVGLSGASASPPQPPCTPPLYQQHPLHQQQQQQQYLPPPVPEPAPNYVSSSSHGHISFSKRTASRESIRSMAFLNNGPPAYNLNYHTPPDSETTM
ncbi:inactive histone-lysine N-methyltransferase 2E isoform X2 [Drosophila novamexicana]|uniref:inactive histone-lysine N-methyltransferase 2E isoform X2 n=2 Tax=Drosophila novamexicana TaxID=47314 RepID=UPI0011E5EAF3|nr:inactive histone-lysine N-methyltransferase 2E isoform X2 [Drosophila novamexicana]